MRRSSDHSYQNVLASLSTSTAAIGSASSSGSELGTVRRLGWSVVEGNLRLGKHEAATLREVRAQYERLFDFHAPGSIPLNLRKPVDPGAFDLLGRAYEDCLHVSGARRSSGGFYSHPEIVRHMVEALELEKDAGLRARKFIDIACGAGVFLVAALQKLAEVMRSRGSSDREIVQSVPSCLFGLDINPIACELARINLYLALLNELGPETVVAAGAIPLQVYETNAIENRAAYSRGVALQIKRRNGRFGQGFDYVLGNPPYLEAKMMSPRLKEVCLANFPDLDGAFDLYVAFLRQCDRLASEGGKVHLILPDKFTVARYAKKLRERLLAERTLLSLSDLSGLEIFSRARVYPILLCYQKAPPDRGHRVATRISVGGIEELGDVKGMAPVPQSLYGQTGSMATIFCLPAKPDFVGTFRRIFGEGVPMGEYLSFRSSITFHKKGLRERFVRPDPVGGSAQKRFKYLGGVSYSRKTEVRLLGFAWQGYRIDYDQATLADLGNKLPPLENFTREKIVFCQHARRITAAYDGAGEYVTKDVYPIAFARPAPEGSPFTLKYFAGLLNSELLSFLYNTLYKGVQISGGYYHYLPTWLEALPVLAPAKEDIGEIESLVEKAVEEPGPERKARLVAEVDEIVYRAYDISEEQRALVRKLVPPWPAGPAL